MDDTECPNLFFGGEFAIVKPGCGVVEGVNVGPGNGKGLSFMGETKVALLVFVVDVRYFSEFVRLLFGKETQIVLLRLGRMLCYCIHFLTHKYRN